ncbi:MAG TPA: DUF4232 domain-containing protein [Candidatus Saccharimonadales bacterium]|nr:DUF4232 domain-containing protein [Candidatus Saccharimonadales bacterium]
MSLHAPSNARRGVHPDRSLGFRSCRALISGVVLALLLSVSAISIASVGAAPIPKCVASQLSARIVDWQGAAGSRIADVLLVNTSFASCVVRNYPHVSLVSSHGVGLISGGAASTTAATHTLFPLGFLKTEVQDSNYCGPSFSKPVTLTFVLPGALGRVVAIPRSSADTSGVPPCLGSPGSAGHISMHAWHT